MNNDSLGDRMKSFYEGQTQINILRRTPVIIRLDGKAFHTFVKSITSEIDVSLQEGPFSQMLHNIMCHTTLALCERIQNVKLAMTHSDEISLLLTDYETLTTDQWFGGNVQKMTSISASIASVAFNQSR